jgi:hypothetical protein
MTLSSIRRVVGDIGAAVDDEGRVLVLQRRWRDSGSGTSFIAGQWFDRDGTALTASFVVSRIGIGDNAYLTGVPLYGSEIAIRLMTYSIALNGVHFGYAWIAVVPSGSTEARRPPEWLTSRHNTDLVRTRGGYALLPLYTHGDYLLSSPYREKKENVRPCEQQVEIVSAAGLLCGTINFPIAAESCYPSHMRVGLDGTLLQMLPLDRETSPDPTHAGIKTCTVRFWPAALR